MTCPAESLESLRRELDAIDDEMHDLLMRRVEIVGQVASVKNRDASPVFIRPEREALILRRLIDRHGGRLPAKIVVRLWREILAAAAGMQSPLAVAVYAPDDAVGYWDLARDHYGSGTRMTLHGTANAVVRAVVNGTATVGVVPLPQDGEAEPWWPQLVGAGENTPSLVTRLPFIANDARPAEPEGALAIARLTQQPTGDDVSMFVVEADAEVSRDRLNEALKAAGLPASIVAVWRDASTGETRLHLAKAADFLTPDDARFAALGEALAERILRIVPLGGYAVPLGQIDGA
jgi:chorismate mutase-like protein